MRVRSSCEMLVENLSIKYSASKALNAKQHVLIQKGMSIFCRLLSGVESRVLMSLIVYVQLMPAAALQIRGTFIKNARVVARGANGARTILRLGRVEAVVVPPPGPGAAGGGARPLADARLA